MTNNNVGGANQWGGFELQPGYGQVGKTDALTREAPMSGSPIATHALEQPRRSGRQAQRQPKVSSPQPVPPAQPQPPGAPQPSAVSAQVWQQIAATPGASPLVQQYAQQAQGGA